MDPPPTASSHPLYQFVPAPTYPPLTGRRSIFLAGSTSSTVVPGQDSAGTSTSPWSTWRSDLAASLRDLPVSVMDPFRSDWNDTWLEDEEDEQFRSQVEWELHMHERADLIVVVFAPETKAPVSLLEMGLAVRAKVVGEGGEEGRDGEGKERVEAWSKALVVCPDEFWKKGNVRIVCKMHGIECLKDIKELDKTVRRRLRDLKVHADQK